MKPEITLKEAEIKYKKKIISKRMVTKLYNECLDKNYEIKIGNKDFPESQVLKKIDKDYYDFDSYLEYLKTNYNIITEEKTINSENNSISLSN